MGNTKTRGILRFMIFKEPGEKEYTGVCYELSIVLTDSNPEKLKNELTSASRGYVDRVIKSGMPDKLLNQSHKLPDRYKNLFKNFDKIYDVTRRPTLTEEIDKVIDARAFVERVPALV